MKTLFLGNADSIFYKSIGKVICYLNVEGIISEHKFAKSIDVVEYVKKNGFTHVLMPNPYGNNKRLNCFQALKKNSINVIASDRGALPNTWFFDSGFNAESSTYKAVYWDHPLSQDDKKNAQSYIDNLVNSEDALEENGSRIGGDCLKERIGIRKDQKIVFVPLQRPEDTVIKYFSNPVGSIDAFMQWVAEIESKLNGGGDEYVFVLKKHPLEVSYPKIIGNKNNIKYIYDDAHVHDCIAASNTVLLINSGVGVLALAFGVKVICCGQAFYAQPKLAHSATSASHAADLIVKASAPSQEKVLKFYNYLISKVYSFGELKSDLIRKDGSLSRVTKEIDFSCIRILSEEVFNVSLEKKKKKNSFCNSIGANPGV